MLIIKLRMILLIVLFILPILYQKLVVFHKPLNKGIHIYLETNVYFLVDACAHYTQRFAAKTNVAQAQPHTQAWLQRQRMQSNAQRLFVILGVRRHDKIYFLLSRITRVITTDCQTVFGSRRIMGRRRRGRSFNRYSSMVKRRWEQTRGETVYVCVLEWQFQVHCIMLTNVWCSALVYGLFH